ncbi:MAG TPA: ABC transporter ATP-binding protein [Casimicrobiaceae bacterium]|nr:ABC transporter ATP-binding protein [Casimicrobiaceae bacterium]
MSALAPSGAAVGTTHSGVPIELRSVSKTFGEDGDQPFRALGDISMTIESGEFVSVVGPSGCGKSTLMLMVAGLLPRSAGDIVVGGKPVTRPLTDVGIAFQDHLLLDFRTAIDNVMLQAEIRRLPRGPIEARAKELFEQLRLTAAMKKYPRQLSGGMRQRVSLVRALVHDPSVIMMDEPFGALDALTRDQLVLDLQRICHERRIGVLFITHSVAEAVFLSDQVIVMTPRPGRIERTIDIDLPRPRTLAMRETPEFARYSREILDLFLARGVLREH